MSVMYVTTKGHGYVAGLGFLLGAVLTSEGYAEPTSPLPAMAL